MVVMTTSGASAMAYECLDRCTHPTAIEGLSAPAVDSVRYR